MSRFDLDLENLPKPHLITATEAAGRLQVCIGLSSAEDALKYAAALGVPVEADSTRPTSGGHYVMRSVSASKTSPGVVVHLAGSSVVLAETAGAR
jgi:hypothetical protein